MAAEDSSCPETQAPSAEAEEVREQLAQGFSSLVLKYLLQSRLW